MQSIKHALNGTCCDPGLERVRYFTRQLITAEDMRTEQDYFRQKLRRHNRYLHGWGVACGCTVKPAPTEDHPWRVVICAGYAVGPQGDEISICDTHFDLAGDWLQPHDPCVRPWPCPPTGTMPQPGRREPVYLAVRHAECESRPQRVHPVGCSCDDAACEYSRIRDDFELALLWELPECYKDAAKEQQQWSDEVKGWFGAPRAKGVPMPVPPCTSCCDCPWVVLATITLPPDAKSPVTIDNIWYKDRRVLYSVTALQEMFFCLE